MGKSKSSSQANQSSSVNKTDDRIINESGIVARDSNLNLDASTSNNWLTNYNTSSTFDAKIDDRSNSNNTSNSGNTTITNTSMSDSGAIKAAFDFAIGNNATNGQGFDKLLTTAAELTKTTQDNATSLANRFTDNVAQAWDTAKTTTPGGIDNKTMIILGVAAAAALVAMKGR
jgi:hypothetical protein